MPTYNWKRFSCNETKRWDATKTATGKTARLYINGRMNFAKTEAELAGMLNVADGQVHWNQESAFSSFGAAVDQSWYYASTSSALCTYYTKQYTTTAYYAKITGKKTTTYATLTYDIYHITNVRYEYSKGTADGVVTSTDRNAYPDGGRHSDGYWYEYIGETAGSTMYVTYQGNVIATATVQPPAAVTYNGGTIASIPAGQTKTLACNGKIMKSNVAVGGKTLTCAGKVAKDNITITLTN